MANVKQSTVKQLMAKFSGNHKPDGLTPMSFEEQVKQARHRELEEIRLAKEKARLYNATLRAKSIQIAQEQSALHRSILSPLGGQPRSFHFASSQNPRFEESNSDIPVIAEEDERDEKETDEKEKDDRETFVTRETSLIKSDQAQKTDDSVLLERMEESRDSFEGKTEERKDIVGEMYCPPTTSVPRVSIRVPTSLPQDPIPIGSLSHHSSAHISRSLASAPSMKDITTEQDINLKTISGSTNSLAVSHRDTYSRASSLSSTHGIPEGGYEEIHETVRMNRPSVSDLLLRPGYGERNYSLSSVGPLVEAPDEEHCRLSPGIDLRTVVQTFYQTYAPEKLEDLDLVLKHFKGRSEALLFTLECKYFVNISPDGHVTPYRPSDAPPEAQTIEDERVAARRGTMFSDMTDWTTDSYKGYAPADARDGGLPSTLANSWAVKPKHDSGRREGRKPALLLKKVGSDIL